MSWLEILVWYVWLPFGCGNSNWESIYQQSAAVEPIHCCSLLSMDWHNIESKTQQVFSGVLKKYQWQKWCDVGSETENDPIGELEPTFFRVIFPAFNKGFGCSYVKGKNQPLVWVDDFGVGYFKQPIFILWLKYDPKLTSEQRLIELVNEWLDPAMDMIAFNEKHAESA